MPEYNKYSKYHYTSFAIHVLMVLVKVNLPNIWEYSKFPLSVGMQGFFDHSLILYKVVITLGSVQKKKQLIIDNNFFSRKVFKRIYSCIIKHT